MKKLKVGIIGADQNLRAALPFRGRILSQRRHASFVRSLE